MKINNSKENNNKNKQPNINYYILNNVIDINEFLEPSQDDMDYDDVVESDKRTFCQYIYERIKDNHIFINTFFIQEIIKRKSIKIAILI